MVMFVACGIWCLAEVSSVSPSSGQTAVLQFVVSGVMKFVMPSNNFHN